MKSIKDLREQYQVITEKEDKEQRKLTALVRAGLFDAKKLPMLKRALEKGVDKMTPAEKKILIDLLDSLMNQVVSNEPVYMKVKRNVQSMDEEVIAEVAKTPVTIADVPSIVVLKRKAVRVYPGGQQVGLYYSQQLDKYVTIPFGEAGISEEVELEESRRRRGTRGRGGRGRRRGGGFPLRPYYYDDDDIRNREAERTPYDQMTQDQKDRTKPLNVLARSAMDGDPFNVTAAKALMAFYQRRKGGAAPSPTRRRRPPRKSPTKATPSVPPKASNTKPPKKQTTVTPPKRRNAAQTQQRMKQIQGKNPTATFSPAAIKNAQIKEAVILKLMERQQLYEYGFKDLAGDAADIAIPGVSAYKNFKKGNYLSAAGDLALDVGSAIAAPFTGGASFAGRAALKGALKGGTRLAAKSGAKSGGKKGSFLRNLKALRLRNARRARGRRRDLDFDYYGGAGGGGGMGGGSSGPTLDRSKYAKDVTNPHTSQLKTQVIPAQWDQGSDASVDRATARRERNRLYSQQNESVEVNLDGNLVEINSGIAEKLVNVYESLNDYNKQKMVDMLLNEETQHKIVEFVRRY